MSLTPLLIAPTAVQIHALSAILAIVLGALVLFRRKGTRFHKFLGRTWALLMLVTATSAIFINEIRLVGPFSPIHVFVLFTYAGIVAGIWQIRKGNVQAHRATMQSLYFGALGLAGAFTLLPGRRMHDVLFGASSGMTPTLIAVPLVLAVTGYFYRRMTPRRRPVTAAAEA